MTPIYWGIPIFGNVTALHDPYRDPTRRTTTLCLETTPLARDTTPRHLGATLFRRRMGSAPVATVTPVEPFDATSFPCSSTTSFRRDNKDSLPHQQAHSQRHSPILLSMLMRKRLLRESLLFNKLFLINKLCQQRDASRAVRRHVVPLLTNHLFQARSKLDHCLAPLGVRAP